jgi:radical SAM superfamily enzyme YgiQ (UPF0313 family)
MFGYDYDFPPYRPPNEAGSALIRVTRGCPWNKCAFCDMYKNRKFQKKPVDEVKKDVQKARKIFGKRETIFIADSDNLLHQDLPEIMRFIRKTFPEAKRVTSYARAKTILRKDLSFLKECREAGLDRLHVGLESGDAELLEKFCKGATPEVMIKGGQKAKEAGFELSEYVLCGAGGPDRWRDHAINSAKVLNEISPDFIRFRTLTVQRGTPLWKIWKKGEFELTPPLDRLREVEIFIETLVVEECELYSDHMTNYLWADDRIIYYGVHGDLPDDKVSMLDVVRQAIEFLEGGNFEVKDSNDLYREGKIVGL